MLPGVQLLDVAGPLDVFAEANVQSGRTAYQMSVIGVARETIVSSSGVRLIPDQSLEDAKASFDTLLIAGAPRLIPERLPRDVLDWIRAQVPQSRRFGSVCSGALVLAATGLIAGRRVTTHWAMAEEMARLFPDVELEIDALHVRDGPVRTAAGVTAGLDLSLALVEEDLGRDVAKKVASQLVMFFKRPGGQLQFSRNRGTSPSGYGVLQEIQRWVIANPAAEATTQALAERAGLSGRHFARLFKHEMGMTPAAWVEKVRIDHARQILEAGDRPKQAASRCGFADIDTFRRAFQRQVGVTPAEYRRRYEGHAAD